MLDETNKAISMEDTAERVRLAWHDLYINQPDNNIAYVSEVFDAYVIVRLPDRRMARVTWTIEEDGSVTFAPGEEWEIVEHEFVPVKALPSTGEWELEVLGIPYGGPLGGKDLQGEYFSPRTRLHEDKYPYPPVVYYHGMTPDRKPAGAPEYIGKTVSYEDRPDGRWYRVILNKASALAKRIWEAAKQGLARASSGSIPQLARVAQDGHILEWPVVELSLLDATEGRQPANAYALALPIAKAVYQQAGLSLPDDLLDAITQPKAQGRGAQAQGLGAAESEGSTKPKANNKETDKMAEHEYPTPEQVAEIAAKAVADALKAKEDQAAAEAARKKEVEDAVAEARKQFEAEAAKANRLPFGGSDAPVMAQFAELRPYDHLDAGQAALAIGLYKAFGFPVRPAMLKAAAVKALEDTKSPATGPDVTGYHTDSRVALKALGLHDVDAAAKANEAMYSASSGFGDDWVTVQYSNQLWEKIRQGTPVLERIGRFAVEVPQGSESIQFQLESTDPTWYLVAQATATSADGPDATITSSRVATANKSLTVSKLGARVPYTGEVEEDSIIPIVPQIEAQIMKSGADYLEHVIIDGHTDTDAGDNINDTAGTPAGAEAFLAFNGLRALALITNTANARDGGTLTVDDFLETIYLMGAGGKNAYGTFGNISFVMDPNVNKMALRLPEVKTRDVFSNPTVERGLLASIWNYEVLTAYNMHLASLVNTGYEYKTDTAGHIDLDTASNNTKGAFLAVRWDQWRLGFKRRITLERMRWPYADLTEIVAMMRAGLAYRDIEAAAISYNLTV